MKCVKPLHIRVSYHKAIEVIWYIPIVQCVKCDCTNTFYFVFWIQRAISLKIIPLTRLYSRPSNAIYTDHASKSDQKEYWVKLEGSGLFAQYFDFGQNFVSKLVTWQKSNNSLISTVNIRACITPSKWAICLNFQRTTRNIVFSVEF